MGMNAQGALIGLGLQYYALGRCAAFAGSIPITGCLLHNAIERFLKGYLIKSASLEKLKDKYGHDLNKLWEAFKDGTGDSSLARLDGVIKGLDKFEPLRYPNSVLEQGINCTIGVQRFTLAKNADRTEPVYSLFLDEIDDLAKTIVELVPNYNPKASIVITNRLRELLKEDNEWQLF